jgi:mannose-6-phosphate isomerase-like protein (cupin superfamily)
MSVDQVAAQQFSLRGAQLLVKGQTMDALAESGHLWLHLKIYAEGGENRLHKHPVEDHAFLILDGEAEFLDGEGRSTRLGRYDGILIPRGVVYSFRSVGQDNLVMLRAGAGDPDQAPRSGTPSRDVEALPAAMRVRRDADGSPAPGNTPADQRGAAVGEPRPGAFFGLD